MPSGPWAAFRYSDRARRRLATVRVPAREVAGPRCGAEALRTPSTSAGSSRNTPSLRTRRRNRHLPSWHRRVRRRCVRSRLAFALNGRLPRPLLYALLATVADDGQRVGRAIAWLRIVARFKSLTHRPKAQCWVSAEGIPEARRRGWRGLVRSPQQRTPPASREKKSGGRKKPHQGGRRRCWR